MKMLKSGLLFLEVIAVILIILRIILNSRFVDIICNIQVLMTCITHIIYYAIKNKNEINFKDK